MFGGSMPGNAVSLDPDREQRATIAAALGLRSASTLGAQIRQAPLATGVDALDELLGGGLPRGRIVEVVGHNDAPGRLSLIVASVAAATVRGELVGLVDGSDRLDPRALLDAGATLSRVLWIRPANARLAFRAADIVLDAGGFGLVALDLPRAQTDERPAASIGLRALWARLARRAEHSGAALLVTLDRRAIGTFATASLQLHGGRAQFQTAPGARRVLSSVETELEIVHTKLGRPRRASYRIRLEHSTSGQR
jgi:hypothetical protein